MNINTTITDLQASSLAASLHVSGYKDGNELIAKCAAAAELRVSKQALIQAIAVSAFGRLSIRRPSHSKRRSGPRSRARAFRLRLKWRRLRVELGERNSGRRFDRIPRLLI